MAHAHAHPAPRTFSVSNVGDGVAGGLVGGVVFGILMQMMGMIPMIAMLVGSESTAVGWLVHLFNSALFGAVFAVLFGRLSVDWGKAIGLGLVYGAGWWVLGALLIMPLWLGMDPFVLNTTAWQSLVGHLLYGLLLGIVFATLARRQVE
jgi:uncharacterized membrane protein YagU involved in acid resistance